jgi:RNA chaperone Hfq
VWVFLITGIRLTGSIALFDICADLLQSSNGNPLIFRHAIATVREPLHASLQQTRS